MNALQLIADGFSQKEIL